MAAWFNMVISIQSHFDTCRFDIYTNFSRFDTNIKSIPYNLSCFNTITHMSGSRPGLCLEGYFDIRHI